MISKTRLITKKHDSTGPVPVISFLDPDFVYLATSNTRCNECEIFVKEGEYVKLYQQIGIRHAPFFDQPIHSTVSGEYVGLEKHFHRNGKNIDFIKIKNDFKYAEDSSIVYRSDDEIKKLSCEEIVEIVKNCAMVGLGGSSFPTYIKLKTEEKINTILVNGIECEPFISADNNILWEESEKIIKGMEILRIAYGAEKCILCIKNMKKTLIKHYEELLKNNIHIEVKGVGNFYPQGWEIAMIKSALGIEIKPGVLPTKYGILDFNVTSILGIYQALSESKPVTIREVSISGDGINKPTNFKVRVGTLFKDILLKVDGYKDLDKPKNIIIGGPMMGASIPSDDCVITKTVTSIIIFNNKDYKEEPCVRCGSCVLSCPVGLEPVQIMNAVKSLDKERVKFLNPNRCIECGLCTYSCTSKIRVLDYVRRGKLLSKL